MAFGVLDPGDVGNGWWENLPIVGGIVQWTQAAAQAALAAIRNRIGQYRAAKADLPEQREAYIRAIVIARESGRVQQSRVADWGAAIGEAEEALQRGGGAVEQVASWVERNPQATSGMSGLGVVPVIPLAVLAVLALATWAIEAVVTNWQRARLLDSQVRAGFTPEQIARAGLDRGGSTLGQISNIAMIGLAIVAFVAVKPLLAKAGR